MEKTKTVPRLRFPGFADEWEQRKLSEVLYLSSAKNSGEFKTDDVLAASLGTELQKKRLYFGLKATNDSVKNYKIVYPGDVIYTKSPIKGFPNGIIRTSKGVTGIVPTLYCVYHSIDSINPSIIQAYFENKERLDNYLTPLVNVGARNNVNITDKEFLEGVIRIPSDYEEQNKIIDLLETVSTLIVLYQNKLDSIKLYKQGLLQKMFPKEGEKVPEIRFPGFTGDWEQRKLLDCIQKITDFRGRTPKKLGLDWSDSGYLALSALNVKDGYIDFSQDVHYGNQELYDKWMTGNELHKGQVLFTTEAPMGNVAQVPDDRHYILSQRTIAFDVKSEIITEDFLATVLRTPTVFSALTALSSGGTAKGVSQKSLASADIIIPRDLKEQEHLSSMFLQIDNLITLHQRKIDSIKLYKQGLLRQMFV